MFRKHKFIKNVKSESEPYLPEKQPAEMVSQMRDQYSHRMFNKRGCDQSDDYSVNVNVVVNEKDDGMEKAIKGCFKCCLGIGKAAAK